MIRKSLIILFTALLTLCIDTHAEEQLTIWAENYPPFGYEEGGEIRGLSTDVTREMLKRTDIKVKSWRIASWKDAYANTLKQPNSLLYTVVRKPDRENKFHWIGPIADRTIYLYKLVENPNNEIKNLQSLEDVKRYGYVVGAVSKTAAAERYRNKGIRLETVTNYYQNILKLHLGRIDLASAVEYNLEYLVKKHDLELGAFVKALMDDNSKKYYVVVNLKADPNIVQQLQKAFKTINDDGTLSRIQNKYLN